MTDVVRTVAKDGSKVEFIYKDPAQGAIKDVYFAPDKSYVVAFFRKPLDPAGRERVEKIVGQYRSSIFDQAGGEYWKDIFCWPEKIVEYDGKTGIVVPAYRKEFFFGAGALSGAEKEGKWFASAKNFNRFVPPEEKGSFTNFLHICLLLSRGVRRLHAAGLAHSDLSYKNCLIDPKGGNACIIDVDGLVVPGLFPPDVLGTPDFIAPEVVMTADESDPKKRVTPSRATDLHALAVLIYLYMLHRHPLRGRKVHSQDNDVQEKMEMGEKALFIENPGDTSNRPKIGQNDTAYMPWIDVAKLPYAICGPYLKELFDKAFIDGLHDPSKRPSADDWEDALIKTSDLIQPCENPGCVKKWFVYNNKKSPVCPYCGTRYTKPMPLFDFYISNNGDSYRPENRRMMIFSGQSLYKWHVDRLVTPNEKISPADTKRLGYFSFYKGRWMLVNEGMPDLEALNGDTPGPVAIGKGIVLKSGLQLKLSSARTGRLVNVQMVNG